jgi:hypothetical protein
MSFFKPRFLVLIGLALLLLGLFFDVIFAGLPYQDPTPEIVAGWILQKRIAQSAQVAGLILLVAGSLRGALSYFSKKRS